MTDRKLRLEYHLTDLCNINCKSCSHFSCLVKHEEPKTLKKIEQDFAKIYQLTNNGDNNLVEKVSIMGGEPLLYKNINTAIPYIRSLFKNVPITLLTNGSLLFYMGNNFYKMIRDNDISITISFYPIDIDYENLRTFFSNKGIEYFNTYTILKENIRVFDTKFFHPYHDENYEQLHYNCRWREWCTQLVDGKIYLCALIAYFKFFDEEFKDQHIIEINETDCIDLEKINTWEELQIERDKVPHFCGYCRGLDKNLEEWEYTRKNINEWYY